LERNRLSNGGFWHDLDNWTASDASYAASDGDEHYGMAVLGPGGGYVEQEFTTPSARSWTVHLAIKPDTDNLATSDLTLRVVDGDGNTVLTQPAGTVTADAWTEQTYEFGLAPGTTYTLRIKNNRGSGDIKVDDVWVWWVPLTRAELATRVNAKLARLASTRSLSTTPAGALTEGDYTYAVDAGLRAVGAIDPETDMPDVRYLEANLVDTALDAIEQEMIEQLQRDYAVEVDVKVGPRQENFSQRARQVKALAGGGGSGRVVMRKLTHQAEDFELGD
jgi:hypothetical protein